MELDKFIKIYDNVFKPEAISSLIVYLNNKCNFEQARIIGNNQGKNIEDRSMRNTKQTKFDIGTMSGVHWLNFTKFLVHNVFLRYNQEYPTAACQTLEVTPLLYEEGGFYKIHSDHHATIPRTISVIIFLNNDYEGGELNFHDITDSNKGKIFKTIKPHPGRIVMWPSNFLYPHSVSTVTKGRRYTLVSWIL